MKAITPTVAVTAAALTSSLVHAASLELPGQSVSPHHSEEVSQMIVRPKNQLELAKNLKYIFDNDLVLQDEFYTEASLRDLFGLDAIRRNDDATTSGDSNISIVSSKFSSIFPQSKSLESQKFIPGANLTGGKTTFKSGVIAAAINF